MIFQIQGNKAFCAFNHGLPQILSVRRGKNENHFAYLEKTSFVLNQNVPCGNVIDDGNPEPFFKHPKM